MKALHRLYLRSAIALMLTLMLFSGVPWRHVQPITPVTLALPDAGPGAPSPRPTGGGNYFTHPAPAPGTPTGRRTGGGSLGAESCVAAAPNLTALVPVYSPTSPSAAAATAAKTIVYGKTSSDRPSFWFYTPYTSSNYSATFSLIDRETGTAYSAEPTGLPLPTEPSIFKIASTTPLSIGKHYRWNLKIFCGTTAPSATTPPQAFTEVYGEIERVSLNASVVTKLRSATTDAQRLDLYAEQGLWFDALTTLITLKRTNPSAWNSTWESWLETIDLSDIAQKPLEQ